MAALKIKTEINELKEIDKEIKRLNEAIRPLRQRKKQLEANILQYMNSNKGKELTTIKVNDLEITAVEKTKHERMNKSEKESTAIQYLQQSGVPNPRKAYNDLQQMLKGAETTTKSLKVVNKNETK